jgi:hypothetical protein
VDVGVFVLVQSAAAFVKKQTELFWHLGWFASLGKLKSLQ